MTFSGMFAIGLSGVNAFSESLEAVSNNIANTQTAGYKRARTDFSTLVTAEAAGGGIFAGGVGAASRQLVSEQGAITRTDTATHMAISGDGFFVVSETADGNGGTSPLLFTRSGGFSIQEDGTLRNEAGHFLRAAPIAADGNAAVGGLSGLEVVDVNGIDGLAEATSTLTLAGNLDANAGPGTALTQHVQIFDADGAARTLALTFTSAAASRWSVTAAFIDGAQETVATGDIVFAANGRIDASASSFPAAMTLAASGGQSINLDFGSLTQGPRTSQFTAAAADGAAFGALTGVEISRDGRIAALFANGLRRDIYQIALATFVNPEGLNIGPDSTFLTNSAAGDLSLNVPQTGRAGAVEAGALEISTVDIAQEFSTLIETQRAYAANTRVITIADELWRMLTQTAA